MAEALAGAIIGALLGALVTEYFARRRERAADLRHRDELVGARADVAADRVLELRLQSIEQTRRQLAALLAELGAIVAGPGASMPGRYAADVYPRADPKLVGDAAALREYWAVATELAGMVPASGLRASVGRRMAAAEHAVSVALDEQEKRLLAGEQLRELPAAELPTLGGHLRTLVAAIESRPHGEPLER